MTDSGLTGGGASQSNLPKSDANHFRTAVYLMLAQIPAGRVTTYGAIARALGSRGYRAVGRILNQNPNAPQVPCHRVVMSDGSLGGYAHGRAAKQALLSAEGVLIQAGRIVDFETRVVRELRPVQGCDQ